MRYDSLDGAGELSIRDSTSREWTLGRVPAPATRVLWLDRPPLDSVARRALDRAFDESSLYDETVRTASFRAPASPRRAGHQQVRRRPAHRTAHSPTSRVRGA